MNKEESFALFAQGRDAWNTWAATMSAEREALEAAGTWTADSEESEWNDSTRAWHTAAKANFSGHQFKEKAGFSGFVFPGEAMFNTATFSADAMFGAATFSGNAWFGAVTFSGDARFDAVTFSSDVWFFGVTFSDHSWFGKATFSGEAWFSEAAFSGGAWFSEATFSDKAMFPQAVFAGFTQFADARFEKAADFRAIGGKGGFSLSGATFLAVPDFIQAHFAEAPLFDSSRIQPLRFQGPIRAKVNNYFKGDPNLSARWRALKRLAVQGHDHLHELEFFKNELKTRRWSTNRLSHLGYWSLVRCYGLLSGFGRSIIRPLIWWAASAYVFALLYMGAAKASPLNCLAGPGDPWRAALGISARKALLIFGLDSSDKLTQHYACLYGVIPQQPVPAGQLPAGVYLNVPDSVIALGIAQHIVSAVLLFLLLLAVRNHFRIK